MTRLCHLPIKSLRLVQRTLSTGLKAAYWHINRQTNASITQVSSLHFLIHFIYPRLPYRQIMIQDLLNVCGFDDNVNLSDALLSLRVNIGKFTDCIVTDPSAIVDDTSFILPNEIQSLRRNSATKFYNSGSRDRVICQSLSKEFTLGISIAGLLDFPPMCTRLG